MNFQMKKMCSDYYLVMQKFVISMLMEAQGPKDWDLKLPAVLLAIRKTPNKMTDSGDWAQCM